MIDRFWAAGEEVQAPAWATRAGVSRLRLVSRAVLMVAALAPLWLFPQYRSLLTHPVSFFEWPVFWVRWLPVVPVAHVLFWAAFASPLVAVWRIHRRGWRVLALTSQLLYYALVSSQRGIDHQEYLLLSALLFLSLTGLQQPAPGSRSARRDAELFWASLVSGLFFYSLAGLLKVVGIAEALAAGDRWLLDPTRVPPLFLERAVRFPSPVLLEWVFAHPVLAHLGYLAAVTLELVAVAAAFSPRAIRPFLLALAGFHLVTWLTMDIFFERALAVLLLWALLAPLPSPLRATARVGRAVDLSRSGR